MQRIASPAKVTGYTLDAYGFRTTILDRPAAQVDDTDHGLRPDQIADCGRCETDHCTCTATEETVMSTDQDLNSDETESGCGYSYDHTWVLIDERDDMATYVCSECDAESVEE